MSSCVLINEGLCPWFWSSGQICNYCPFFSRSPALIFHLASLSKEYTVAFILHSNNTFVIRVYIDIVLKILHLHAIVLCACTMCVYQMMTTEIKKASVSISKHAQISPCLYCNILSSLAACRNPIFPPLCFGFLLQQGPCKMIDVFSARSGFVSLQNDS